MIGKQADELLTDPGLCTIFVIRSKRGRFMFVGEGQSGPANPGVRYYWHRGHLAGQLTLVCHRGY